MNILRLLTYVFVLSLIGLTILVPQLSGADPLDNWHVRNSPTTNTLRAVTYGNGLFVAVGDNGTILTSLDGENWHERTSETSQTLQSITHGNGTFAAVGGFFDPFGYLDSSVILFSPDGISWVTAAKPMTYELLGITYGNGTFVAVGINSTFLDSPDGVNWSYRNYGPIYSLYGVSFGEGIFVAAGYPVILTSPDGGSWTERTRGVYTVEAVTYGDGMFVAVGGSYDVSGRYTIPVVVTSPDGIMWTQQTVNASTPLWDVAYGNNMFVALGNDGTVVTTVDGIKWASRISGTTTNLYGAVYGNGTFVAVGGNGTIIQSDPVSGDCTATLSHALTLKIPIIDFNGTLVAAEFQCEQMNTSNIIFKMVNVWGISDPADYSNCQASTLSFDTTYKLHVPAVLFDNLSYRADFEYILTDDNRVSFTLTLANRK